MILCMRLCIDYYANASNSKGDNINMSNNNMNTNINMNMSNSHGIVGIEDLYGRIYRACNKMY